MSEAAPPGTTPRASHPWRMGFFLLFVVLTTLILIGLGAWQWQRRGEKAAFIAALSAADQATPLPYAQSQLWDRVRISGRYLHEKTVHIHSSQPESGFGVYVMTPLAYPLCVAQAPCGEGIVLINRGFMPITPRAFSSEVDTGSRQENATKQENRAVDLIGSDRNRSIQPMPVISEPEGEITLTGIRRPSEREGIFPPYNTPAKGQYFHRDTRQMAAQLQLGIPGDDFIDRLDEPGDPPLPKGLAIKTLVAAIPNNHLSYVLTWWGLALANLGVAGVFMAGRRRG